MSGVMPFAVAEQFIEAMREMDMKPPQAIAPGRMYRFPGIGKAGGNTAGWCRLFSDSIGGVFGDWAEGITKH